MHSKSFFPRTRLHAKTSQNAQVSYSHAPTGVLLHSNIFRLWILSWKVLQELVRQLAKLNTKQEERSFVQRGALKGDSRCSNYVWRWNMKKLDGKNERMYFGEKKVESYFPLLAHVGLRMTQEDKAVKSWLAKEVDRKLRMQSISQLILNERRVLLQVEHYALISLISQKMQ